MCFAGEQENARLVLSPFIHETLLTRRTLWNFTSRFIFTTLGSVYCSFRGLGTMGLTIGYYYYYSLARPIYIYIQLSVLTFNAFCDRLTHGA